MYLLKARFARSIQLYPPSESTTQKIINRTQSSHSTTPRSLSNRSCPPTKHHPSSGKRILKTLHITSWGYLWRRRAGLVKLPMSRSKLWVVKPSLSDGRSSDLALLARKGIEHCGRVCWSRGLFTIPPLTVLAREAMIQALGKWAVKNVRMKRTNCKARLLIHWDQEWAIFWCDPKLRISVPNLAILGLKKCLLTQSQSRIAKSSA